MAGPEKTGKRIGVLTAGSDSPGLNAAIRAIGKAAGSFGMEVIGFQDGFQGLLEDRTTQPALSGILTTGGTILGTSREMLHNSGPLDKQKERAEAAAATYHRHDLDGLVCIGGREAQESALLLARMGLNIITLPKDINNDVAMTDSTIGFDTAMGTATDAIDRLHSTAHSHHRIILVEIMGRHTGWLALGSGVAGGADVIIIPEIPYDVQRVAGAILDRNRSGRRFSIVAVAEGGISRDTVEFFERSKYANSISREGDERSQIDLRLKEIESRLTGNTIYLANRLEKFTGLETRITILGHLLRGGAPSSADRVLATNLGTACMRQMNEGKSGVMVGLRDASIVCVPLDQVIEKHKPVPLDHPWIESARRVGTCLGD
jgi:6-phosphofructokinase 1